LVIVALLFTGADAIKVKMLIDGRDTGDHDFDDNLSNEE